MKFISITALALCAATPALAQQGVSPTEIVIGTAQDLSGPIVNFSKAAVNGMRMRIDEANAAGVNLLFWVSTTSLTSTSLSSQP